MRPAAVSAKLLRLKGTSACWYRNEPRSPRVVTADSITYFNAFVIVALGTLMPMLRASRSATTWQTVIDMSESRASGAYRQPPLSFCELCVNSTARSSFSRSFSVRPVMPYTSARNSRQNAWLYMRVPLDVM